MFPYILYTNLIFSPCSSGHPFPCWHWKSLKQYLIAVFRSSAVIRWSFTIPQSKLSHVVKPGLQGGLTITDQHPIYHPLNLSSRYSLTGRASCAGAPSVVSRPLSQSCGTNHMINSMLNTLHVHIHSVIDMYNEKYDPVKWRPIKWQEDIAAQFP